MRLCARLAAPATRGRLRPQGLTSPGIRKENGIQEPAVSGQIECLSPAAGGIHHMCACACVYTGCWCHLRSQVLCVCLWCVCMLCAYWEDIFSLTSGRTELQQPHLSSAVRPGVIHFPLILGFLLEFVCSYQDAYAHTRVCQQFEKDTTE